MAESGSNISRKNTAAILLAAGRGLRYGADKLSAPLGDATILEHAANAICGVNCFEAACVINDAHKNHTEILKNRKIELLMNKNSDAGISESIRLGVEWAIKKDAKALLIALADMPFILSAHLRLAMDIACRPSSLAKSDLDNFCHFLEMPALSGC